jgi:hypothetical protein
MQWKVGNRDGQTAARSGPGEARSVLGLNRQTWLGNRVEPAKPVGLILFPSSTRNGPKRAGLARLAREKRAKSGLSGSKNTF